jgi:hypothetical protein
MELCLDTAVVFNFPLFHVVFAADDACWDEAFRQRATGKVRWTSARSWPLSGDNDLAAIGVYWGMQPIYGRS